MYGWRLWNGARRPVSSQNDIRVPASCRHVNLGGRTQVGAEPEPRPHVAATVLRRRTPVNGIIYLVGLVVVVMFILSFLGLR
jgi:hypothetical protein